MIKISMLFAVLTALALPAQAAIYKYVDAEGRTLFTDTPMKGAKRLDFGGASAPSGAPGGAARKSSSGAAATPSPASFPRVDSDTQRKRDDTRRKILEDELSAEKKLLEEARKQLSAGEATRSGNEQNYQRVLERLQPLKDNVTLHEKNIAALQKELSNIR
jgi:hypothetical protein